MAADTIIASLHSIAAQLGGLEARLEAAEAREVVDDARTLSALQWEHGLHLIEIIWGNGGPIIALCLMMAARGRGPIVKTACFTLSLLVAPFLATGIVIALVMDMAERLDQSVQRRRGQQPWLWFLMCCCRDDTPTAADDVEVAAPAAEAASNGWFSSRGWSW